MGWLVGILFVILCLVFWRVGLPILGIAAILLFAWTQREQVPDQERLQERAADAARLRATIAAAQREAQPRQWRIRTQEDPGSGESVPRSAVVRSDDGLCELQVQERITGGRLTSISCTELDIINSPDLYLNFGTGNTSEKMALSTPARERSAYIRSSQSPYGEYLQYDEFLRRMSTESKVSLRLRFRYVGGHWIRFSLNGSTDALGAIGAL